jgi:hypothetical protein
MKKIVEDGQRVRSSLRQKRGEERKEGQVLSVHHKMGLG